MNHNQVTPVANFHDCCQVLTFRTILVKLLPYLPNIIASVVVIIWGFTTGGLGDFSWGKRPETSHDRGMNVFLRGGWRRFGIKICWGGIEKHNSNTINTRENGSNLPTCMIKCNWGGEGVNFLQKFVPVKNTACFMGLPKNYYSIWKNQRNESYQSNFLKGFFIIFSVRRCNALGQFLFPFLLKVSLRNEMLQFKKKLKAH